MNNHKISCFSDAKFAVWKYQQDKLAQFKHTAYYFDDLEINFSSFLKPALKTEHEASLTYRTYSSQFGIITEVIHNKTKNSLILNEYDICEL